MQLHKGIREVASGVEQLYWGLLAARRLQTGCARRSQGAELLAQTKTLERRTALVEARQAVQQIQKQLADVQEQLNGLLDLPLCTTLELVEPVFPPLPYRCADEVIGLGIHISPEVHECMWTLLKAEAAVAAGKLDYVPSIAICGEAMSTRPGRRIFSKTSAMPASWGPTRSSIGSARRR